MKEIKFGAWNKKRKKMYWNVQNTYDNLSSGCDTEDSNICCFGDLLDNKIWVVIEYSGKKDINNREMYEGHIVKNSNDNFLRQIWWSEDEASFKASHLDYDEYCDPLYLNEDNFEIVGNIFENPQSPDGKIKGING